MKATLLKGIVTFTLLAWASLGAMAQADVDSPYSLFGVGQVRSNTMNTRLKGMGGLANAEFGQGMINTGNPASYAKIDTLAFLFDAGVYFKSSTFSTSTQSEKALNASFNYMGMAFGITPWWKTALGVQPYSTSGYIMTVDSQADDIGHYATSFKGTGGLNQVFWGNAFRLGKHFAIGANAYYVFGNSQSETTLRFPDSLYILASRRSIDLTISSFMFDYGLLCDFNVSQGMKLSFGLTYDQGIRLRGKQTVYVRSIEEDGNTGVEYVFDTIRYASEPTKLTMPQGIGFGVMLQKSERWSIGADFNWTQWSKFAREGANDQLYDSWNVAVGAEFFPKHTSISNYFTRASYRLGGFYEHGYLVINGQRLNRVGITAGISLPLPRTLSRVNLALEVGQYGTHNEGLVMERYVKLNAGISVFERWFMKRKYK